jgi:predicted dehydrogenase
VEHEWRDDARRRFVREFRAARQSSRGICSSGPSRFIEYHPIYHPFNWRGWTDWGVGAIGDMGAHLIDSAFWSLDLDYPTSIETTSTPYNHDTYPMASTTYYEFPAKGARPAVKMTWYDGGLTPPKPRRSARKS